MDRGGNPYSARANASKLPSVPLYSPTFDIGALGPKTTRVRKRKTPLKNNGLGRPPKALPDVSGTNLAMPSQYGQARHSSSLGIQTMPQQTLPPGAPSQNYGQSRNHIADEHGNWPANQSAQGAMSTYGTIAPSSYTQTFESSHEFPQGGFVFSTPTSGMNLASPEQLGGMGELKSGKDGISTIGTDWDEQQNSLTSDIAMDHNAATTDTNPHGTLAPGSIAEERELAAVNIQNHTTDFEAVMALVDPRAEYTVVNLSLIKSLGLQCLPLPREAEFFTSIGYTTVYHYANICLKSSQRVMIPQRELTVYAFDLDGRGFDIILGRELLKSEGYVPGQSEWQRMSSQQPLAMDLSNRSLSGEPHFSPNQVYIGQTNSTLNSAGNQEPSSASFITTTTATTTMDDGWTNGAPASSSAPTIWTGSDVGPNSAPYSQQGLFFGGTASQMGKDVVFEVGHSQEETNDLPELV